MAVVVASRGDLTLEAVRRAAWEGEGVELSPGVAERMDRGHAAWTAYVDARLAQDPDALLYGVTTGPGDAGTAPLTEEARTSRPPGLVEGHAAARALVAAAVAAMLDGGPLPPVPARGNDGAGEILALGHLFGELAEQVELEPKEKMALVNGSPCAAALVADAALAGRGRLELAERAFALSVEAIRAPLEAFAPELRGAVGRRARG